MALVGILVILGLGLVFVLIVSALFRVVVSTNDVHIVQSAKRTISYGKDQDAGNTYYKWPSWIPIIGIKRIILPVSVFNVNLNNYSAYDIGRVPFTIDVMAFFRIEDSNVAAQRVHSFEELNEQLKGILQGAIRSILASSEIEHILQGRSEFGLKFTEAVDSQIKSWGVTSVKNVELMDIRDAEQSQVITNIMAKKKSLIEKESRVAVAENQRIAKEAEINAKRDVDIRAQEAEERVGQRTAEKDKQVGIAKQRADQQIKEEEKLTATKRMSVIEVERTRAADIERQAKIIQADQERQMLVINAEAKKREVEIQAEAIKQNDIITADGTKAKTVTVAQGDLEQAKLHAQGVQAEGLAKGEADKAILLAPVVAQITLAEKISTLDNYQAYLLKIREIEKNERVGMVQAEALKVADVKVIANTGDVVSGVGSVMDLFTTKGGTQVGGMLEALAQTDVGKGLIEGVKKS